MNKYQQALETLYYYATHNEKGEKGVNDYILSELSHLKLSLEKLVDKATPKKPDKYVLLERDSLGFPTNGYCKTCGTSLLVKNNYCGRCGQAIDWSE